jgi:hypothetical protein
MTGLDRIIGQETALHRLKIQRNLFQRRGDADEHILLVGEGGMGKRTIARAFAEDCRMGVIEVDAGSWENSVDLTSVVSSMQPRQALLVLSIGKLREDLRKPFSSALREREVALLVGQGRKAHFELRPLRRFPCIVTARAQSDCAPELLDAFSLIVTLEPYSQPQLEAIAMQVSVETGVSISPVIAGMVATACGGLPLQIREVIRRLARIGPGSVSEKVAAEVLHTAGLAPAPVVSAHAPGNAEDLPVGPLGRMVRSGLDAMGFRTELSRATAAGITDMIAQLDRPLVGGRYLVRCIAFTADNLVDAPAVREFHTFVAADRIAIKGVLVTTTGFTGAAREFARETAIELLDLEQFTKLVAQHDLDSRTPSRAAAASV